MSKEWPRPLSYSSLKELNKSPAHIRAYWQKESVPTKKMRIGKLYHAMAMDLFTDDESDHQADEIETAKKMVRALWETE